MSQDSPDSNLDLAVRYYVYRHFVNQTKPPTTAQTAKRFGLSEEQARQIYRRLHENHYVFLQPGSTEIRMANPLSAVPTQFRVHVGAKSFWANCAWDMLGIPAMIGDDACIEAAYEDAGQTAAIGVRQGRVVGDGGMVHFPLPARRWYDDLILT